jgi:hypothetical protein
LRRQSDTQLAIDANLGYGLTGRPDKLSQDMNRLANFAYNLGASILSSARRLTPFFLILLLLWFLLEISLAVWRNPDFQYLAIPIWLFILAVAVTAGVSPKVQWEDAVKADRAADPSPSLSLFVWNAGLIAAVMFFADWCTPRVTFVSPLLKFYQLLFRMITGTQ